MALPDEHSVFEMGNNDRGDGMLLSEKEELELDAIVCNVGVVAEQPRVPDQKEAVARDVARRIVARDRDASKGRANAYEEKRRILDQHLPADWEQKTTLRDAWLYHTGKIDNLPARRSKYKKKPTVKDPEPSPPKQDLKASEPAVKAPEPAPPKLFVKVPEPAVKTPKPAPPKPTIKTPEPVAPRLAIRKKRAW